MYVHNCMDALCNILLSKHTSPNFSSCSTVQYVHAIMDNRQRSTLVHTQVYKLRDAMPNSTLYRRLISDEAVRLKKPFSWNEWCINPPEVQLLIILCYFT